MGKEYSTWINLLFVFAIFPGNEIRLIICWLLPTKISWNSLFISFFKIKFPKAIRCAFPIFVSLILIPNILHKEIGELHQKYVSATYVFPLIFTLENWLVFNSVLYSMFATFLIILQYLWSISVCIALMKLSKPPFFAEECWRKDEGNLKTEYVWKWTDRLIYWHQYIV